MIDGDLMDFGQIMKTERIRQNISQQKLADEAGVTKRAINYWESGKRKMTVDCADRIFKALGITVEIGKWEE